MRRGERSRGRGGRVARSALAARVLSCLLVLTGLGGCGDAPAIVDEDSGDAVVSAPINGIGPRVVSPEPNDPHLTELLLDGDHVIVANSNSGIAVYGLGVGGELPIAWGGAERYLDIRCTTIAAHWATRTLFCGHDPALTLRTIGVIDIADPERPEIRLRRAFGGVDLAVADLQVIGDRLFLARFRDGVSVAQIDGAGELGELRDLPALGNARRVSPLGDGIAVLTADRGLVYLREDGSRWREVDRYPLDGPTLGLATDGARALVAQGSDGALLLELRDDRLRTVERLTPPLVVIAGALREDALALVGAGGLFLYDLRGEGARLVGFGNEHRIPLDVALRGDELIVSDWMGVTRAAIDLDGVPFGIQAPRAAFLRSDASYSFVVRNPGVIDVDLRLIEPWEARAQGRLPAGETLHIDLPPETLAAHDQITLAWTAEGARSERWELLLSVAAPRADPIPPPPTGERFPDVTVLDEAGAPVPLLTPGERARIAFFSADCAALWPILEDAAWLSSRGDLDGGATLIPVATWNGTVASFSDAWIVPPTRLRSGGSAEQNPTWLSPGDGPLEFQEGFRMPLPDIQCTDPTDYLVGSDGTVEAAEREYLGRYHLRGAPPLAPQR